MGPQRWPHATLTLGRRCQEKALVLVPIPQLSPRSVSCLFLSHTLSKDYLGERKRILVTATLQISASPASWRWAGLGQEC